MKYRTGLALSVIGASRVCGWSQEVLGPTGAPSPSPPNFPAILGGGATILNHENRGRLMKLQLAPCSLESKLFSELVTKHTGMSTIHCTAVDGRWIISP